ncbi:MAG TPA: universal stress protein [Xanthobacteraceae bacterium]|jgi:nucleotide-binding universal stress UspA family protein|nr:universal stress protein [Xanthobacteraceae bacterium]
MIRDILVNLTNGGARDAAGEFAIHLAARLSANLTGLAVTYEMEVPPFYMGALPTDFIDAQIKENEEAALKAAERFGHEAAAAGIVYETRTLSASLGIAANRFASMARLFDLTVVAQPDPDRPGPEEVIAETVLMDSGRAVLLVPYVQTTPLGTGRAVIAWDGSRAAARALNEGMPLLHLAKTIEVLSIMRGTEDEQSFEGCAEVARHLARHGLKADVHKLHIGPGQKVADTILNEVSDQGADFVIMGGYGHSRLKELVMGGVTREILDTMTVPVLMAH